ncbi:unnamed protein product [Leptidea sinapis]|uniref:Uncharacterized protein n=1 Tax=Leptidea sinapis TaxID=189913 RepID=A0A5E4Q115_9NEOP|nr:unnamed protein product [Leptidea sinapis]
MKHLLHDRLISLLVLRKMTSVRGIIAKTIQRKLQSALETKYLEVINESFMHNVPKDAETHFKVVVWDKSDKVVESSPNCRGGFGR